MNVKRETSSMLSILKKIGEQLLNRLHRKLCSHDHFIILGKFGPTTGRHKTWYSCRCEDCGQYFVFEESDGRKHLTDGPGFGIKKI